MPETVLQTFCSARVKAPRAARLLLVVCLCFLPLTACGKRPSQVDPPVGVSKDVYTREYPDIRTDGQL